MINFGRTLGHTFREWFAQSIGEQVELHFSVFLQSCRVGCYSCVCTDQYRLHTIMVYIYMYVHKILMYCYFVPRDSLQGESLQEDGS